MKVLAFKTLRSKMLDQAPEVHCPCFKLASTWKASNFVSLMILPWKFIRHLLIRRALPVLVANLPLCKDKLLMLKGYWVSTSAKRSCFMSSIWSYNTTNMMTRTSKTKTPTNSLPPLEIWASFMFRNLSLTRSEILWFSNQVWSTLVIANSSEVSTRSSGTEPKGKSKKISST